MLMRDPTTANEDMRGMQRITCHYNCETHFIGNTFQTFEYAFGLPKRSNYKSIIDEQLLKYREQGLIETLWKKWSNQPAACSDTQSGDDRLQMGLVRLSGLFYILLAGVAASVCILVLEFVAAAWVDSTRGEDISVWGALKKRIILLKQAKIGKSEENKKKDDRVAYD